jgi:hypothetical protein
LIRNEAAGTARRPRSFSGMVRIVGFFALVVTALTLIPYGAHLFSLPNKIGMSQEHYFIAQRAYDNWALMGLILFPALAFNLVLAYLLRGGGTSFVLAVAGCLCMAATFPVFFSFTYPANVATQNWTVAPDNWADLRTRWEYSHAANAVLSFAAFCLMTLACLTTRR